MSGAGDAVAPAPRVVAADAARRPAVVVVGPTPPPHHGMTTATLALLASPTLSGAFRVLHLDTADRRSQENMGRLDLRNVVLALAHAARLAALLVRRRPELVYLPVSQNRWAYVRDALLIVLSKLAGARVLTHLNGAGFRAFYESADAATRLLVRATCRLVDGAAVLGDGLRPIYEGLVPAARTYVVPNGVADPFPEGPPRREGAGAGAAVGARPPRVTYLSTLIRSKGFPELLRVAGRLRDAGVAARWVLAGAWNSEAERLEALDLVARLGLEDVVAFPGVVTGEAKRRVLAEADIFVLPTRYPPEGQPFAILEAMAAGLPVVSTPRGAIPDTVQHGVTGLLVPEGDEAALAAALTRLLGSPAERRSMGEAGRGRYVAGHTQEAMAGRLVAVMERVQGGAA